MYLCISSEYFRDVLAFDNQCKGATPLSQESGSGFKKGKFGSVL